MAQKAPQLIYKETENKIVLAINEALNAGLPFFVLESMIKNIYNEIQQNSQQQYEAAQTEYEAQVAAEAKETTDETTSA